MNIVILGAGAMGAFFGGLLAKNGNQVTLVDVNQTHVDAIKERGLIKEGYYADIIIFDSNNIIDKATFEDPHQYAIGIDFVLVNGTTVVEKGDHNGNRPGRILFGPGYRGN